MRLLLSSSHLPPFSNGRWPIQSDQPLEIPLLLPSRASYAMLDLPKIDPAFMGRLRTVTTIPQVFSLPKPRRQCLSWRRTRR